MDRVNHLKIDKVFAGEEYNEIHKWLDETFPKYAKTNPYKHWFERHHQKAIKEKYGSYTREYNIAYLHILCDFLSHYSMAFVPVDETDCKLTLKSLGRLKDE